MNKINNKNLGKSAADGQLVFPGERIEIHERDMKARAWD